MNLDSLRQIESLAPLSRHQLARASKHLVWRRYAPGSLIFPHQVPLDVEGIVYRGRVRVSTVQHSHRQIVDYIHAGELIRPKGVARNSWPVELRAVEPTVLCLLPPGGLMVDVISARPSSRKSALKINRTTRWFWPVLLVAVLMVVGWQWQSPWKSAFSQAIYGLASYSLEAGNVADAASLLQTSVELNPRLARAYNDLGYIYYRQGQQDQALAAFHQATTADPTLSVAQNNLGLSYQEAGQLDLARDALRQAVALDPESAAAWVNLGVAEQQAGQSEEAIRAYQAALRLDPYQAVALVNLGTLYYQLGMFAEAQRNLKLALVAQPDLVQARLMLGAVALSTKDYDEAWTELQIAGMSLGNDPLLHFYLGLWFEQAGKLDLARQEMGRVLALQPQPDLAAQARSHLVALAP